MDSKYPTTSSDRRMTDGWPLKRVIKSFLLHLIWKTSPGFFRKKFIYGGQIFAIGIYTGKTPFAIAGDDEALNPVVTAADVKDIPAAFVADPFLIRHDAQWYMFFEVYNQARRRGEIGVATSADGRQWRYRRIVLRAPFHLSYPYVFKWHDQFFMIPESAPKGVDLYRARNFPYKWELHTTLIDTKGLVDSTIFCFDDTWWLFTSEDGKGADKQTLRLFFADEPTQDWREHPQSPLKTDRRNLTRCAGRVIQYQGRLFRFAQNGFPAYGTEVRAFEVVNLTRKAYQEEELDTNPVLCGSHQPWNQGGMHHLDAHCIAEGRWMACVDGWYLNLKSDDGKSS